MKTLLVRLPDAYAAELARASENEGQPMAEIVRRAIADRLKLDHIPVERWPSEQTPTTKPPK